MDIPSACILSWLNAYHELLTMTSDNVLTYSVLWLFSVGGYWYSHFTRLRQLKEAVAIFSEALRIDNFFLEAYVSRGNAFLDYGHDAGIKAAQADYQRALLINPIYIPARWDAPITGHSPPVLNVILENSCTVHYHCRMKCVKVHSVEHSCTIYPLW